MDYLVAKMDLENIHDFNKNIHCIIQPIPRINNLVF